MHIAVGVSCANPLDRIEHLLAQLLLQRVPTFLPLLVIHEKGLVRERPWHVNFNLVSISCREFCVKLSDQSQVVCVFLCN